MANNQRTMPHNLEAEQCLLSAIFLDNEISSQVFSIVKDEDFYSEANRTIFRAMYAAYSATSAIELPQVSDILTKSGEINNIGGMPYLSSILRQVTSSANYSEYIDILKENATRRALIKCGQEIIENGFNSTNSSASLEAAEKAIFDLGEKHATSELIPVRNIVGKVVDKVEELYKDPSKFDGIKTGFKDLDFIIKGLQKGNLVVIGARPGDGKTSLGMNIAVNVARSGKRVAVFELEMVREEIVQRMLAAEASVPLTGIQTGMLTPNDVTDIMAARESINKYEIYIDDNSVATPAGLISKCRSLKRELKGLDLVVVDYAQLMQSNKKEENRQNEVADITRNLKVLAKELNCPVLALCQLNRDANKTKRDPQLTDLRESGQIEQDADVVIFIYKDDDNSPVRHCRVAKNRSGKTGQFDLGWNGELTLFQDQDEQLHEQLSQLKEIQKDTKSRELVSELDAPMPDDKDAPDDEDF